MAEHLKFGNCLVEHLLYRLFLICNSFTIINDSGHVLIVFSDKSFVFASELPKFCHYVKHNRKLRLRLLIKVLPGDTKTVHFLGEPKDFGNVFGLVAH